MVFWQGEVLFTNIYGACVIHTPVVDQTTTFMISAYYNGLYITDNITVTNRFSIEFIIPQPGPLYENMEYTIGVIDADSRLPIHNAMVFWQGEVLLTNIYGACPLITPDVNETTTFPLSAYYNGSNITVNITIYDHTNSPPNVPNSPSPGNNSIVSSGQITLRWIGGDPDAYDVVYYDIFFNGVCVFRNMTNITYYNVGILGPGAYTWQIIAHDSYGGVTHGPLWRFRVVTPSIKPTPTSIKSSDTIKTDTHPSSASIKDTQQPSTTTSSITKVK